MERPIRDPRFNGVPDDEVIAERNFFAEGIKRHTLAGRPDMVAEYTLLVREAEEEMRARGLGVEVVDATRNSAVAPVGGEPRR